MNGLGSVAALDVPTGLGKTSAMTAWLVAKSNGAALPRRLIYIVDRRAVVDQATDEALRLRAWVKENRSVATAIGLADGEDLPVSTLRGQFADNRQWLADPARPAIVVGTVDMIGSRLLFEGYGVSRKMRPFHAGFLGADALFVLDEAHLVPPFEALMRSAVATDSQLRGDVEAIRCVPSPALLTLSATGRNDAGDVIQIEKSDLKHPQAAKRLNAIKQLRFCEQNQDTNQDSNEGQPQKKTADVPLPDRLADEAWRLCDEGTKAVRIIVFTNSRDQATKTKAAVEKRAKGDKKNGVPQREIQTELFVGARRVRERQQVAQWLDEYGFLGGNKCDLETPAFVFATSAGEVGVDMDADHMVCDLVSFERMIQRFGRVNRRGEGAAEIRVVVESDTPPNKTKAAELAKALAKPSRRRSATEHKLVAQFHDARIYRQAMESLPRSDGSDAYDASPESLRQLKLKATKDDELADLLNQASTPAPLRPELTRPVLDAWSMTSLEQHSGRPNVAPWLRGWDDEEDQATLVWRRFLPTLSSQCSDTEIERFFESAPVHLTEKLETSSERVAKWLSARAEKIHKDRTSPAKADLKFVDGFPQDDQVVCILLSRSGKFIRKLTLHELRFEVGKSAKREKDTFARQVRNAVVIVHANLGGIGEGMLVDKAHAPAPAADDVFEWLPEADGDELQVPVPPFRVHIESVDVPEPGDASETSDSHLWKACYQLPIQSEDVDEPTQRLMVEKYRGAVTSEESRSTTSELELETHLKQTESVIDRLVQQLDLPPDLQTAFRIAARNHDWGKDCDCWQEAFSAPRNGRPYAKTRGPLHLGRLQGYRHEFGSLPSVGRDPEFGDLSVELQDLALHLVATHHGFGRPVIRVDGCQDAPPSQLAQRARDVALRFARLQKWWGPWELAWLESILRSADQQASAMAEAASPARKPNSAQPELERNHG